MLSTKLINAINYQTNLDDSLQHSRHELEAARQRIAQLEQETQQHKSMISSGALVNKAEVDTLKQELTESQKQRDIAEKGRKEMEVELETLTSALFEEANTVSKKVPIHTLYLLTRIRWSPQRAETLKPSNVRTRN